MVGDRTRTFVAGEIKEAIESSTWRWRALDVAMKVAMPILLGVSAWAATTVLDHESRLKVIENTRYTDREASRDRGLLVKALGELRIEVTRNGETSKAILRRLDKIEAREDARDERERERDRRDRGR